LGSIDQNMNAIEIRVSFFSCWLTADEVYEYININNVCVKQVKTLSIPFN